VQVGAVLSQISPGAPNAYAKVTQTSGANPFFAYGVVNDGASPGQRSGDGAFQAAAQSCSYSVSAPAVVGPTGGTTSLELTAAAGCPWDLSSDAAWLRVTPPPIPLGGGTIGLTVDANAAAAERNGALNLAGSVFAVRQLGNVAGPYDGSWNGDTAQAKPIRFTVAKNEVTSLTLSLDVAVGFCHASGSVTSEPSLKPVVQNSMFSTRFTASSATGGAVIDVGGTFASGSSASGTVNVPIVLAGDNVCLGNAPFSWTATK